MQISFPKKQRRRITRTYEGNLKTENAAARLRRGRTLNTDRQIIEWSAVPEGVSGQPALHREIVGRRQPSPFLISSKPLSTRKIGA